jgi:hypothetical protein
LDVSVQLELPVPAIVLRTFSACVLFVGLLALVSRAAAPATWGAAIDVPLYVA